MKLVGAIAIALFFGFSAQAADSKLYSCKLKKMKAQLEVKVTGSKSEFRFKTPEDPKPAFEKTLQSFAVPRQQIASDPFLARVVRATGVTELRNVFSATVYITDSNNVGMSGLMVVQAGPSRKEFMSFFAAGADLVLPCSP